MARAGLFVLIAGRAQLFSVGQVPKTGKNPYFAYICQLIVPICLVLLKMAWMNTTSYL
jgi:hypothetical protein